MPPTPTRNRGRGGRCRDRVRWAPCTNLDPEEMLHQSIQPDSQCIADPSSSNGNILLNNSGNNTDVSSMVELLEIRDMRSKLHIDRRNLESFNICYVTMTIIMARTRNCRSMNVFSW